MQPQQDDLAYVQGTPEWLELRRGKITVPLQTVTSVIMGANRTGRRR